MELGALLVGIALSGLWSLRLRRRASASRARSRPAALACLLSGVCGLALLGGCGGSAAPDYATAVATARPGTALAAIGELQVKGRAARSGYDRDLFGPSWYDVDGNGCDTRDDVLRRDLTTIAVRPGTRGCVVVAGTLADPYTATTITFSKSRADAVQIDHVVALSAAWQTGAQGWSARTRLAFANDPLNLLAVDGQANQDKGDADAATWLPPAKGFRCTYVSRQVAVKVRYHLWVTPAERDAMARVLRSCPGQPLP